jgi:tetratricopeptide (TPR) repeat protein
MQNLQEIIKYLKDNKYILISQGKYIMSQEFQQACKKSRGSIIEVNVDAILKEHVFDLQKIDTQILLLKDDKLWPNLFVKFIQDAKVPARLEDNRGNLYSANKYNEDARKVFQKALEKEGFDYDLLVKSTMLYYKSGIRYKKAIGTYFTSGEFRTDYLNLKQSAEAGTETLQQHLKEEINNGQHNRYTLG